MSEEKVEFVAEAATPPQKNGWYIRVCDGLTEARTILLDIGYGGDPDSHHRWGQWDRTVPTEFDVPPQFRTIPEIWINGYAIPEGRNAEFCLCYQDHVVKRFQFDNAEDHEQHQQDTDDCRC